MAPYRPPGRSNRSGRTQDNDVFEGLPVKQWGHSTARISLAPPASDAANAKDDKWGEPPMPRDYQMLHPYVQQLLRLARSGKVSSKRRQDSDADDDKPEEDAAAEETKVNLDERGYVAKKWKPVPEHQLEPEHKHFEFLAKRRRGLPSLYGPDQQVGSPVLRKTKVRKADANGEVAVYEVLVPEGQTIEGEVSEAIELPEVKPVAAGTVIEGVGIANEYGVVVAEHLRPTAAPRRNRPPPKKKGGPGRGKKRVTFTNPDGTTYTTVVPNATKIVPQPGQTVKHVAKGEEAIADVTAEQAAAHTTTTEGEEDGSGSDDGEEGDEDDDDREEGEISQDEEIPATVATTPAPEQELPKQPPEDIKMNDAPEIEIAELEQQALTVIKPEVRAKSSSPDLPLAQEKFAPSTTEEETTTTVEATVELADPGVMDIEEGEKFDDGDDDLLGNLEKHIQGDVSEA